MHISVITQFTNMALTYTGFGALADDFATLLLLEADPRRPVTGGRYSISKIFQQLLIERSSKLIYVYIIT